MIRIFPFYHEADCPKWPTKTFTDDVVSTIAVIPYMCICARPSTNYVDQYEHVNSAEQCHDYKDEVASFEAKIHRLALAWFLIGMCFSYNARANNVLELPS